MSTERRVIRLGRIKDEGIEGLWSRWWWRLWVAIAVVAFTLTLSVALVNASVARTQSDANVDADAGSVGGSVAAVPKDANFDFLDHELRIAGGYGLLPGARIMDASFDFLDHEFRYAGGYTLRPVARTPGDCVCPLLENELELTRGDGLLPAAASTLAAAGVSDSVRYIPWVIMNVLEGLSRSSGLSVADASDPLQVTSLEAKEAARRARSMAAYAARYQGMADAFAMGSLVRSSGLSIADASDPLQVTSLEAKEAARRARSMAAYGARYQGMADAFAMGSLVRSSGLSIADASDPLQVTSLEAKEAARRARSMAAYAARYQGMADFYVAGRGFCACTPIDPRIDRGV